MVQDVDSGGSGYMVTLYLLLNSAVNLKQPFKNTLLKNTRVPPEKAGKGTDREKTIIK